MTPGLNNSTKTVALCVGLSVATLPAHAIVRWNEGKEQIHVTATAAMMLDSNIYTSSIEASDTIYSATVGLEYRRHAGLIGVTASGSVSKSEFSENPQEGFANPNFSLEFTKDTGRTTGTLGFSAARSTRADPTVNLRTDSWAYGTELNMRYPVSERHAIAGSVSWRKTDYADNTIFVDLNSVSFSADWFYVMSTQRDIFGGYRLRISESSRLTTFADHYVSGGVSGRILPGLNGTARVGYQVREGIKGTDESYSGYSASISATWNFTRKIALTGQVAKDFSTTSTNVSTDTLSGNLDLQYARSAKLMFGAGVGVGQIKFLGLAGNNREDTFMTAYGRVSYTFSERLRLGLMYSYYRNWSTLAFSDFDRNSVTLDATARF